MLDLLQVPNSVVFPTLEKEERPSAAALTDSPKCHDI